MARGRPGQNAELVGADHVPPPTAADADLIVRAEKANAVPACPFVTRTELCFGERLRRAKRQSESRTRLRSALETLQGLGAARWAERTRLELRAAGGRTGRTSESARDSLTAQELQVALVVAGGATKREAAASLFLSTKTVEFHLGNTYRKLNVRSRSELTRVFARDGAPAELPALTSSR